MADTSTKRIKGLLGKSVFKPGSALILKPCQSVHTFFMRFPIDVVFVNAENSIIKTYNNLRPWRMSNFFFSACLCIEFPSGTLIGTDTKVGDILSLK